jgi:PAS domain S-box-containing protein
MVVKRLSHSARQIYRKAPLQAVLILPFVFQTLMTVGLISYFSFRNEQQTIEDLSGQLRQGITNRIEEKLKIFTDTPHAINQLNAIAFANKSIDVDNAKGEEQFALQNKSFPFASVIYCASRSGATLGVGRFNGENSPLEFWVTNATNHYIADYYSLNSQGKRVKVTRKDLEKYDPKQRPWYINAVKERKQNWTHVYLDFSKHIPTITASIPIYNSKNQSLLGVCATDFFLNQETSKFLKNLKELGKNGTTFIMERPPKKDDLKPQPKLVSISTGSQSKPGEPLVNAINSKNRTVQSTVEYLQKKYDTDLNKIKSSELLDFMIGGQKQLVQVLPFHDDRGLNWIIVTVIPEASFMKQIQAKTYSTILLCLAALTIGFAISTLTTQWIIRPLVSLSRSAKALARGEWDQTVVIERSGDLGELATSFNWMAHQLQATFTEERRQAEEVLQRSEAKFRRLFEANLIGVIVADLNGLVIEANDAFLNIVGYTQEDVYSEKVNWVEITPSEYVQVDCQAVKELKTNGACSSYEKEFCCKDGSRVPVLIGYAVLQENQRRVIGFVLNLTQQQAAAQAERKQAEEASILEERNRIARKIHDTLAQAFIGIILQLETVKFVVANDSKVRSMIDKTHKSAKEGLTATRESVWEFRPPLLDQKGLSDALQNLVNKCIKDHPNGTTLQPQYNIRLPPDPLPDHIETELLQIVLGVTNNVLNHANASTISIELTFDFQAIQLRVQDNGNGFDPDRYNGKSVGLVLMREGVQSLGGQLIINSKEGQGTEVVVIVPLVTPYLA